MQNQVARTLLEAQRDAHDRLKLVGIAFGARVPSLCQPTRTRRVARSVPAPDNAAQTMWAPVVSPLFPNGGGQLRYFILVDVTFMLHVLVSVIVYGLTLGHWDIKDAKTTTYSANGPASAACRCVPRDASARARAWCQGDRVPTVENSGSAHVGALFVGV